MKIGSRVFRFFLRLILVLVLSVIFWLLFVYAQQWIYGQTNQIYLIGTNIAYAFTFLFLIINGFFLFSFFDQRKQPRKLRRRFLIFACFYLVTSPFIILSFDNYLLITKDGIQYNPFFKIQTAKVRDWKEIRKIVLDYTVVDSGQAKGKLTGEDLRLKFIIKFENGSSYDLNNYNSPLYLRDQFLNIYQYLVNRGIMVEIKKPLPAEFEDKDSYFHQLFKTSPQQKM